MAGYNGYSMSNNAVAAYNSGEKPLSKWTKTEIIQTIKEYVEDNSDQTFNFNVDELKKVTITELKTFLYQSSWHHTSNHYNRTDFYSLDTDKIDNLTSDIIQEMAIKKANKIQKQSEPKEENWKCSFLEWSGTRKHPKATEITEVGIIRNGWFYRVDGSKKSITANGFKMIEKVE